MEHHHRRHPDDNRDKNTSTSNKHALLIYPKTEDAASVQSCMSRRWLQCTWIRMQRGTLSEDCPSRILVHTTGTGKPVGASKYPSASQARPFWEGGGVPMYESTVIVSVMIFSVVDVRACMHDSDSRKSESSKLVRMKGTERRFR